MGADLVHGLFLEGDGLALATNGTGLVGVARSFGGGSLGHLGKERKRVERVNKRNRNYLQKGQIVFFVRSCFVVGCRRRRVSPFACCCVIAAHGLFCGAALLRSELSINLKSVEIRF